MRLVRTYIAVCALWTGHSPLVGSRASRIVSRIDRLAACEQLVRGGETAVVLKGAKQRLPVRDVVNVRQVAAIVTIQVVPCRGDTSGAETVAAGELVGNNRVR